MVWDPTTPATTTKIKDSPSGIVGNYTAMEDWSTDQHYGLTHGLSGSHIPGQCSVLMSGTTTEIAALTDVPCAMAYDCTLGDMKYNTGSGWTSLGGTIFPGTKMLFYQAAAPVGWTLVTSVNNKLAYITKGSVLGPQPGGQAHTAGSWTITGFGGNFDEHVLTISEMANHAHAIAGQNTGWYVVAGDYYTYYSITATTLYTGGVAGVTSGHLHTGSVLATSDGTWRPAAYNFILCSKD